MARARYIQWNDDEVYSVLDQHADLDLYSANTQKQQTTNRHVVPLGHFIMIPTQPILAITPLYCVLSGEAATTNIIVFGLIRPGVESQVYIPWGYTRLIIAPPDAIPYINYLTKE